VTAPIDDPGLQQRYRRAFFVLLDVATVGRLIIIGILGLSTDESHYVLYARKLAWGYLDHPPMVAFMVTATEWLGSGAFFARLGPVLLAALSLLVLRRLALELYGDERVAFGAAVVLLLMPMHHLISMAVLPDAPLSLFWCCCLLATWKATRSASWGWWIAAGVACGAALLSKYHGALLPISIVLFLVFSARERRWLLRPQPYVTALLAALVFLPNVIWNARNEWVSYAYQLGHGAGKGEFSLLNVGKVVGAQLVAASPVVFGLLVAAVWAVIRRRPVSEQDRFLIWTSIPVFALFCAMGTVGDILPHWTYAGWWSGSLLVAVVAVRAWDAGGVRARRWRRWGIAAAVTGGFMVILLYLGISVPIVEPLHEWSRSAALELQERFPSVQDPGPYRSEYDLSNDLYGWEEAADEVEALWQQMPDPQRTFVFAHRFYTVSQLGIYFPPELEFTSMQNSPNQYQLWFDPVAHRGWDALFVDDNSYFQGPEKYLPRFEGVDPSPKEIVIRRGDSVAHTFRVYRYSGFDGAPWR
jgi:hypothetical protein